MIKRGKFFLAIVAFLAVMSYACKPGCRDPKAFNYNADASADDGTCLYCDTASVSSLLSQLGFDETFGSPHQNQEVVLVNLKERTTILKGNGCKVYGNKLNTNCSATLVIANRLDQYMSGSINVELTNSFGESLWSTFQQFNNIPPLDSINLGQISTFCDTSSNTFLRLTLSNMQYR